MSPLTVFFRSLVAFVPAALFLLGLAAAPHANALTAASLAAANLPGKTLTFTIVGGNAPFETSGSFDLVFGPNGTYSIPLASGNAAVRSGTYTVTTDSIGTVIKLNGYILNNATVEIVIIPTANDIRSSFEMYTTGANKNGIVVFSTGATAVPVITSANTATATVGQPFTYQVTATGSPTAYAQFGGNTGVTLNALTGSVSHTFTTAGTFTFGVAAANAFGNSATVIVTVTVNGGNTGDLGTYAGRYTGKVLIRTNGVTAILGNSDYDAVISSTGAVSITVGPTTAALTGTINSSGTIAFTGGTNLVPFRITSGTVTISGSDRVLSTPFFSATATTDYSLQSSTLFVSGSTPTFAAAPANLVGYRNKVGQVFQFTLTGTTSGVVWGTDVYTDDSTVARAAVHAGVLAVGETRTVTITILPGQSSYAASNRNGVSSASWPAWAGSYSFAGAGAVVGVPVATAVPAVATGFVAGTSALAAGGRLVCPVTVTGGGTYSYRWYLNGVLIQGATANPYIVESLTSGNAGTYAADVTNALGTTRIVAGTVTIGAAGSPVIALQPISKIVVPGATVSFATSATGSGLSYQWFRNNVALAGETGAILLRNNVNAADAGNYTVRISNSAGTITSAGGTLTLSANASRPANISVRTNSATGAIVTPGFVLQGSGTKRVLIRAVGPGLTQFGLTGVMADPKFTVFQGQTQIATNDDWSAANIGQAFVATGAFAIAPGSKDAALVTDLAAGKDYTVQVTNSTGSGGIVLIEVYDADALTGTSTSKLVNVSVRGQTAPGADVLTLGLVIGGTGQRTLLVRGVGPTLAAFGVTGTVADPRLQIYDSQQRAILANDDWSNADFVSELGTATTYVGAFALAPGSKDAATLSLVDPGAYTIQVSGSTASPTGEALVEVYEVP